MSRRRALLLPLSLLLTGGCGSAASGPTYDVTAQSAVIGTRDDKGNCWEADCSPPRTYVCGAFGGARRCTIAIASTAPQWFELLVGGAPASALRTGLTVDYLHGGGAAGDPVICHSNVVLTNVILGAGHFELVCGGNTVVTLGLRAN